MKKIISTIVATISLVGLSGCAVYPNDNQYGSVIKGTAITPDMSYHQPRVQQPVQQVVIQPAPTVYYGANGKVYTPVQVQPQVQYQQIQPQQQYYQPVQPQYYQQQPQYVQQPQYQQYQDGRVVRQGSTGGAILGTAVGGLALSGVGKGNGNLAAIAAGSGAGAVVGSGCRTVNGGQVLGTIVGGLLGSRIGGGSGRQVATGVGASLGAVVGNDLSGGCLGY